MALYALAPAPSVAPVAPVAPRFVMSRPRCTAACRERDEGCAFQVAWAINPHMRVGAVDGRHASRQHANLVRTLELLGATVLSVPFVHGAFDCVFSKDNALVVERPGGMLEALMAHPRHAERAAEQTARASALRGLGIRVTAAARSPLEGGDIVMLPDARSAFVGHGFRSSTSAADEVERFLDGEVTPIELRDERLYHLDMALAVLGDGAALVCDEALTPRSRRLVANHPAIRALIRVPLHEALQFGVNLVQVGKTVVWGANAPQTTKALEQHGYAVEHVALDQFHHAGGSAACLVSRLHLQSEALEERAPQSTAA